MCVSALSGQAAHIGGPPQTAMLNVQYTGNCCPPRCGCPQEDRRCCLAMRQCVPFAGLLPSEAKKSSCTQHGHQGIVQPLLLSTA